MKLDHVVYFSRKTPHEVVAEQKRLGWHAVVGGSHEKWGTYNALMYMKNAYIEWLSVENNELAQQSNLPLVKLLLHDMKDGENWGTVCLSVKNIENFNNRLLEKGYSTSGVLYAERKTLTGVIKKWKLLFILQEPSSALPYPFFIEWHTEEATRFGELRNDGTILPANEKLEVSECIFSTEHPREIAKDWATLLNVEMNSDQVLRLPNCKLKFIEKSARETKERLVDVSIQHET